MSTKYKSFECWNIHLTLQTRHRVKCIQVSDYINNSSNDVGKTEIPLGLIFYISFAKLFCK